MRYIFEGDKISVTIRDVRHIRIFLKPLQCLATWQFAHNCKFSFALATSFLYAIYAVSAECLTEENTL